MNPSCPYPIRVGAWLCLATAAGLLLAPAAPAQSSRPGWGATPYADAAGTGVTFRVWAPNASHVNVAGAFNGYSASATPLLAEAGGVWSRDVADARDGQEYRYLINSNSWRRDPRARKVVHSGAANAVIYDPRRYVWQSVEYRPPDLDRLLIYELHVGTFRDPATNDGVVATFSNAIQGLDHVVDLGFNAVQLMPVAEFSGNNSWGYNPSDPFAVESYGYGGPDGLKALVDACHARGLAVLLDVVHNHYGSDDLSYSLWRFDGWSAGGYGGGIYFYEDAARGETPFGPRPDYHRAEVREYIADNIGMWLDEYRMDGLRWDATMYIRMTTNYAAIPDGIALMQDLNRTLAVKYPERINIAEDLHEWSLVTVPPPVGLGFESDWHNNFHETVTALLTNRTVAGLGALEPLIGYSDGTRRVIYTESHDEVGDHNVDGGAVRFPTELNPTDPGSYWVRKKSTLAATLVFTAPGVPMIFQGQEMLEDRLFSDRTPVDWSKTNTYRGIVRLYGDLARLRANLYTNAAGLQGPYSQVTVTNDGTLLACHRKQVGGCGDDVLVLANFSTNPVNGYWMTFPDSGTWYVLFNSDSTNYAPDYGGGGSSSSVWAWADNRADPYLAPYSALILSQAPPPSFPDHDRDGLPDSWELAHGLDPASVLDGRGNPDHDAYDNLAEYRHGSDPQAWNAPLSAYAGLAVAGDFNGWNTSTDRMALVEDYTWQLDCVLTNRRVEWKIAANNGWTTNWGDNHPTNYVVPLLAAGDLSGANIILSNLAAGCYRFRFNERTRVYQVRGVADGDTDNDGLPDTWERVSGLDPARSSDAYGNPDRDLYSNTEEYRYGLNPQLYDPPLTAYTSMTLVASFNNWTVGANNMRQDTNRHYTWWCETTLVSRARAEFKFAANGRWPINWGDADQVVTNIPVSGTADSNAANAWIAHPLNGTYRFTFNEATRDYSVVLADLDTDGDGMPDWWEQATLGNPTQVDPAGNPDGDLYLNYEEYLYNTAISVWNPPQANYTCMAVAGTMNGWKTVSNMTLVYHHTWRCETNLVQPAGMEFKFAANNGWTFNWGDADQADQDAPFSGTANSNATNIKANGILSGLYWFTFRDDTAEYSLDYSPYYTILSQGAAPTGPSGRMVLRWLSASNHSYGVSRATNWTSGGFVSLATNLAATPPYNTYTDRVGQIPAAWYRVVVER